MMVMFLLLQPCMFSHFTVGGVDPVSSMLEVSQKGGVCLSESTWVATVNSGANEDKVDVAAPYSSCHQRL